MIQSRDGFLLLMFVVVLVLGCTNTLSESIKDRQQYCMTIASAVDDHKMEFGTYPKDLKDLYFTHLESIGEDSIRNGKFKYLLIENEDRYELSFEVGWNRTLYFWDSKNKTWYCDTK